MFTRKSLTDWLVRLLLMTLLMALVACGGETTEPTLEPAVEEPVAEEPTEEPMDEEPTEEPMDEEPAAEDQPSGSIELYTSESEDKVSEMVIDFNEQYQDVQVNVFRSGTGEVTAKLQAEEQAGDIQADIIWFADIDFFAAMAERDLLLSYMPVGGDLVSDEYHYDDNRYHEVRLIFNVIAYNTDILDEPPTGWNDLIDPTHEGAVGMPSPLYSGAAFGQVGTFASMDEFGWEYFEQLEANGVGVEQGNGAVANKLASGEYEIALLVDFFARSLKLEGSPIDHIWPEDGAVLIPTPIGILKDTENAPAAQAFLDYMYTESAQNLFVEQSYVAVLPDMPSPEGAPDMADLMIVPLNVEYINQNRDEIRQNFVDLFGEG